MDCLAHQYHIENEIGDNIVDNNVGDVINADIFLKKSLALAEDHVPKLRKSGNGLHKRDDRCCSEEEFYQKCHWFNYVIP